jgi:hypothetical protein
VAQQVHLELLPRPMLSFAHLAPRPDEIPHGLICRFGHIKARQLPRPEEPRQLVGIPPVGLDPLARLAWHLRWADQYTVQSVRAQAAAQGKSPRPGFGAQLQSRPGMGGLEFFDQLEHVVMFPAENPVTPHLGRIRRRQRHGDRVVVHVQADE